MNDDITTQDSTPLGKTDQPDSPIYDSREAADLDVTCTWQGSSYGKGAQVCIGGKKHECGNNGWINLGFNC